MEIVKLRLQSAETSLTPFEAINELGLRGLYKGSAVTLARDIPYNVLFLPELHLPQKSFDGPRRQHLT